MAYTRITNAMITDVESKLHMMERDARAPFEREDRMTDPDVCAALRESVLTKAYIGVPHIRDTLPEHWLSKCDELQFIVIDRESGDTVAQSFVPLNYIENFEVPKHISDTDGYMSINLFEDECLGALAPWADKEKNNLAHRERLNGQYYAARRQISRFLDSHTSLGAAIKEMPELEMYVPDEYLDRLKEPTAPRIKKPKLAPTADEMGIDRGAIAAMGIAHRITQSSGDEEV